MRQIKFRGKRLDNGEWAYGYLAMPGLINALHLKDNGMLVYNGEYAVSPDSIDIFTGLYDKNNVEIYEGDYIRIEYIYDATDKYGVKIPDLRCICEGIVRYYTEFAGYGIHFYKAQMPIKAHLDRHDQVYAPLNNYDFAINSAEVLGNTLDNPELINPEQ